MNGTRNRKPNSRAFSAILSFVSRKTSSGFSFGLQVRWLRRQFIRECVRANCTELIPMTAAEYQAIRAKSTPDFGAVSLVRLCAVRGLQVNPASGRCRARTSDLLLVRGARPFRLLAPSRPLWRGKAVFARASGRAET